jgi:hypothetical protein
LSNLLWAAAGVNRPDTGKRTAPSARDWREIEIYVAMANGTYVYDPNAHALRRVLARDVRALTGKQDYVAGAPLNLVYVADHSRMAEANVEDQNPTPPIGFIARFCSALGRPQHGGARPGGSHGTAAALGLRHTSRLSPRSRLSAVIDSPKARAARSG